MMITSRFISCQGTLPDRTFEKYRELRLNAGAGLGTYLVHDTAERVDVTERRRLYVI
jgi:hypothetical protein